MNKTDKGQSSSTTLANLRKFRIADVSMFDFGLTVAGAMLIALPFQKVRYNQQIKRNEKQGFKPSEAKATPSKFQVSTYALDSALILGGLILLSIPVHVATKQKTKLTTLLHLNKSS